HASSVHSILPFVFGFLITGWSCAWLSYLMVVYPNPISHFIGVTLLPPFICGLYVGIFFRQKSAKIISIVFTMILSLLYPIFTVSLYDYRCTGCPDYHYVTICCVFAGNLLFVGMIKLVNFISFRFSAKTGENTVFTRNWYRFNEGKFFFATWTHISILQLLPLLYYSIWFQRNYFLNVLAVIILSLGLSLFFFFYWRKSRDKFHQSAQTEPSGTTSE
ncbi:MAG: hypothetical protein KAX09_09475, partial [Candidatus Heimdallarchaeota archaeon]|nr:hypothetical protein [Candidatus Heimdallarchaeota archaeon]MCK4291199.1 hypothetical protein [Candidatus Heimdallarchaeota archaeon]